MIDEQFNNKIKDAIIYTAIAKILSAETYNINSDIAIKATKDVILKHDAISLKTESFLKICNEIINKSNAFSKINML